VRARDTPERRFDIAGAVCESSDIFGRDRSMPEPAVGDALIVLDAGAYGYVMSSNYNLRPRPGEILVVDGVATCVRRAESWNELVQRELAH